MTHVAMFDAVNSIERRYQPYLAQLPAEATVSKEAAAATAAGAVLAGVDPQAQAEMKGALAAYLAAIPDSAVKAEGIKLGEAIAAKILEARAKDGSSAPDTYRPRTTAGVYVPTAPTLAPQWPGVKPFAMTSGSQFRPVAPIPLDERGLGHRLQRDQGAWRQGQHEALRAADRGWPLLARHQRQRLLPDHPHASGGKEAESRRQRALVRARFCRARRCDDCGVRRQVPLRVLASGHRHPQRRHRRQSGDRARRRVAADRRNADASGISLRALHPSRQPRPACWRRVIGTPEIPEVAIDQPDGARRHPPLDQPARASSPRCRKRASGPASTTGSRPGSARRWAARSASTW